MTKWNAESFKKYHASNPSVYEYFVKYALIATKHREYYSAKAIFHRIRWETMIGGQSDYKIDDGWISFYARLFMAEYPQHKDFFQTRLRKGNNHAPKFNPEIVVAHQPYG
jgi:hypothetical protein